MRALAKSQLTPLSVEIKTANLSSGAACASPPEYEVTFALKDKPYVVVPSPRSNEGVINQLWNVVLQMLALTF